MYALSISEIVEGMRECASAHRLRASVPWSSSSTSLCWSTSSSLWSPSPLSFNIFGKFTFHFSDVFRVLRSVSLHVLNLIHKHYFACLLCESWFDTCFHLLDFLSLYVHILDDMICESGDIRRMMIIMMIIFMSLSLLSASSHFLYLLLYFISQSNFSSKFLNF